MARGRPDGRSAPSPASPDEVALPPQSPQAPAAPLLPLPPPQVPLFPPLCPPPRVPCPRCQRLGVGVGIQRSGLSGAGTRAVRLGAGTCATGAEARPPRQPNFISPARQSHPPSIAQIMSATPPPPQQLFGRGHRRARPRCQRFGFGVWGLGFGVWSVGFGVWVWGLGFGGCSGSGFKGSGLRFKV